MAPEKDEMLKRFGDSLKDLKNLRKQLYSAADCFESSYKKHNHKQFVVESSREYVTKALISTVDHLGSAANKLNKYLDEKTTQFCATNIQLSLIQQRLSTMQPHSHNIFNIQPHLPPPTYPNPFNKAEKLGSGESKVLYRNCASSIPFDVQQNMCETLSRETVKKAVKMKQLDPPFLRKKDSREAPSPNPPNFSFTRIAAEKGPGRRSVSPLRFLSGSVIKRSISPTPCVNRERRWASEARRAISAGRRRHDGMMMIAQSRESEKEVEESYTKRSKHLFKALLSLHHSKKDTTLSTLPKQGNPA